MKKLAIILVALFISATSFAQIGIIGGLTSAQTDIKAAATDLTTKMISQYHVGLVYKIPLGKIVTLQPGVVYNVKGATLSEVEGAKDINFKTGYVEVPIDVQIGYSFGNAVRLYGIGEPFLGYAVTNEISAKTILDKIITDKGSWDNVKNRFEYGVAVGGGVELFKHVQINLKYFWNLGTIYGQDIKIGEIAKTITTSKCGGISLSAVVTL